MLAVLPVHLGGNDGLRVLFFCFLLFVFNYFVFLFVCSNKPQ